MVARSTPLCLSRLAKVCRQSCQRNGGIPAVRTASGNQCAVTVKVSPVGIAHHAAVPIPAHPKNIQSTHSISVQWQRDGIASFCAQDGQRHGRQRHDLIVFGFPRQRVPGQVHILPDQSNIHRQSTRTRSTLSFTGCLRTDCTSRKLFPTT